MSFPNDMILVGSINFAEEIDMYNSIKESTFPDSNWYDFVTFDDESNKLWIVWWDIKKHPLPRLRGK